MHSILFLTFEGNTGTVHFCHAEAVVGFYTQHFFYFPALFVGMGFGADNQGFQCGSFGIKAFFLKDFGKADGIAGDSM